MKQAFVFVITVMLTMHLNAQTKPGFDPERFEAKMEQHIVTNANLSQQEAAKFLPVFREMRKKQVALMKQRPKLRKCQNVNAKQAEQLILKQDEIDLKLKKLQQQYHLRFIKILPADKVLQVLRAEETFYHQALRKADKTNK